LDNYGHKKNKCKGMCEAPYYAAIKQTAKQKTNQTGKMNIEVSDILKPVF